MPLDTHRRLSLSAQTSIGGSTTRALSSATATFMPTIQPKSRNSGIEENEITATPEIAVKADTMNARPVLAAVTSTTSLRVEPSTSLLKRNATRSMR